MSSITFAERLRIELGLDPSIDKVTGTIHFDPAARRAGMSEPSVRRAIQSAVLYEANRCLEGTSKKPGARWLRPFQRKIALLNIAEHIVSTLTFLTKESRNQIMCRTTNGKEKLDPQRAFKRRTLTNTELGKLVQKMKPYLLEEKAKETCSAIGREGDKAAVPNGKDDGEDIATDDHNNEEGSCDDRKAPGVASATTGEEEEDIMLNDSQFKAACNKYIRDEYDALADTTGSPPKYWEYVHSNFFLTYRMYYRGTKINPDIPDVVSPIAIVVPEVKPQPPNSETRPQASTHSNMKPPPAPLPSTINGSSASTLTRSTNGAATAATTAHAPTAASMSSTVAIAMAPIDDVLTHGNDQNNANNLSMTPKSENEARKRRIEQLNEVREQLDILKEFDGIIPNDLLVNRKRQLFNALPPVPPQLTFASVTTAASSKKKIIVSETSAKAETVSLVARKPTLVDI